MINNFIEKKDLNNTDRLDIILKFLPNYKFKKCLFCTERNKKSLIFCKNCGFYFCNNIHRKNSHIVLHLRQCKHEKISLYPFESEVKCNICKEKNIFDLKFLCSKKKLSILCANCAEDKNGFRNIIENKIINEEILNNQKDEEKELPAPPSLREDFHLESIIALMNNKLKLLMDINLPAVNLNYSSADKYCKTYRELLNYEIETVENENLKEESYEYLLKFTEIDNLCFIAEIENCLRFNHNFLFYKGQLLEIAKAENEEKKFTGRVIFKEHNKVIISCLTLEKHYANGLFKVKEKQTIGSYERMKEGLHKFNNNKNKTSYINEDIKNLILGTIPENFSNANEYINHNEIPSKLNILELEKIRLNKSQEDAIIKCFKNKLSLIKGPPGTGKSTVLSILAFHLIKLKKKNHKILICAPSNRAVDNISFLLQKLKDIKFVRVLSPEKELSDDVDKTNCLYKLSKEIINKDPKKNRKIIELISKRETFGHLKKSDMLEYRRIMSDIENEIISQSDIVISTICNSADPRLEDYFFQIVIVDEASQSLEPDSLLPLLHRAEMAVLIGDEKQLGPTVISKECDILGLNISLFERLCYLYEGSNFISLLNEQYRMHEFLYRFSNDKFYNNEVITKANIKLDEDVQEFFPWPDKNIPSYIYHYNAPEEKTEHKSYFNSTEIHLIFENVRKLVNIGVKSEDIGIITPYNAQKLKLEEEKIKNGKEKYKNLKIESVDGFQGMEKEYIIISTVRSNPEGKIGFLTSEKRLNVALTRAKKGLIIFGNCKCLSKRSSIWRDLIDFYSSKNLIVKGDFNNFIYTSKEEILSKDKYINDDDEDEKDEEKQENKFFEIIRMNKDATISLKKNIERANAIIEKEIIENKINENKKENENNINNVRQKRKPQEEKEREKGNKRYQNKIKSKQNKELKNKNEDEKKENKGNKKESKKENKKDINCKNKDNNKNSKNKKKEKH